MIVVFVVIFVVVVVSIVVVIVFVVVVVVSASDVYIGIINCFHIFKINLKEIQYSFQLQQTKLLIEAGGNNDVTEIETTLFE